MPPGRAGTLLFLLLAGAVVTACSSLAPDTAARTQGLRTYLAQPQPLLFYAPAHLQLDAQLSVLGMGGIGAPLQQGFLETSASRGLIERFLAATPQFAGQRVRIVDPDQWGGLQLAPDTPVLFFHATWQTAYRRLPPQLDEHRLQLGVIAKVIPLGQVLARKGSIAAPTAAWEANCVHEAYDGRHLGIQAWLGANAHALRVAVATAQDSCGRQLAASFADAASRLR